MYCAAGPKQRQRFLCEVRVQGFNYVGVGNSVNKKDAQTNAAQDFVQFLVRQGEVQAADVPDFQVGCEDVFWGEVCWLALLQP